MNAKFQKLARGAAFGALLLLFVALPGCPLVPDGLANGSAYDVEIQVLADGTLYAVAIEATDEGEPGGEDQDGETDADTDDDAEDTDDDAEDTDDDAEDTDDDAEDTDDDAEGEDVESGFSAQVDAVAADCSSFTVLGGLVVVLEAEDDIGEVGEIGEPVCALLSQDVVAPVGPATIGPVLIDGEEDDGGLGVCDLTPGMWIEAEGEYGVDGIFVAEEIEAADDAETEIESVLGNLTAGTFTMLGLTITYDENTVIEAGGEDGENEDGEDDGAECEQEGENDGDNAGC